MSVSALETINAARRALIKAKAAKQVEATPEPTITTSADDLVQAFDAETGAEKLIPVGELGGVAEYIAVGTTPSSTTPVNVFTTYTRTDVSNPVSIGLKNLKTLVNVGLADEPDGTPDVSATGSVLAFDTSMVIRNTSQAGAEHCPMFAVLRYDQGTGFPDSGTPARGWLTDWTVHGAIGVQQEVLNGINLVMANYYNGQPSDSPAGGIWLAAHPDIGGATDAVHAAATTYPNGVGLGIVGVSSGGANGWNVGIQIGGTGSGWEVAASKLGEGITIRDHVTNGIRVGVQSGSAARAIMVESTAGPVMIGDNQAVSGSNFTDAKLMVQWNDKPFSTTGGRGERLHAYFYCPEASIDTGAAIGLGGAVGSGVHRAYAYIAGRKTNGSAGDSSGYLQIATSKTGVGAVERVRIDADGVFKLYPNAALGGFFELGELSGDAAAPAANTARLYVRDNGSGKTQIVARFPTGAVQVLATEP